MPKPRSAAFFKTFVSGEYGQTLVSHYVAKLQAFSTERLSTESVLNDYFVMFLLEVGEHWRRLTYKHSGFPFLWWQLCGLQGPELCAKIAEFQATASRCPLCVDTEFSGPLLRFLPFPIDPENPLHHEKAVRVQQFLTDCSRFVPVSTDQTEALHGFTQTKLHRFRGLRPTDDVAKEISLWAKVTSAYSSLRQYIWKRTGDVQARRRLAAFRMARNLKQEPKDVKKFDWLHLRAMAQNPDKDHAKQKRLCGPSAAMLHLTSPDLV